MRKTVKIQKRVVSKKTAKGKRYVYTATIPVKILKRLGWEGGTKLNPVVAGKVLVFAKIGDG